MATRFEIVLHGEDPVALRAAGEEALAEIRRVEDQLSLYRPSTEIAHVNARAAAEPVKVSPTLFGLLQQAQRLQQETGGAFDITIAPLVRCWGFMGAEGSLPQPEAVAEARARVGMEHVHLDLQESTVRLDREGVMLDLGAVGKGYAIERATAVLREAGVTSALLHGGTSTVQALGQPPGANCWRVAVCHPQPGTGFENSTKTTDETDVRGQTLATVPLRDEAMSVSAIWGRSFVAQGKTFGHVLDPRTGEPTSRAVLAAVVLPSATETDALSTALLVRGRDGHHHIANLRPGMRTLLLFHSGGQLSVEANGIVAQQ
jgi:thiamine biosynthesis lipoprotein